ncbi:hypothetical protein CMI37_07145 [Candidatus Pacearchaeota archaeon]|nr:hypothetical protein [Candidatus Pacearchaeota archaeon]
MKKINNNSIVLCKGKACCPILTLNENSVTIKDDYGSEVNMTKEQALLVGIAIKELENHGRK